MSLFRRLAAALFAAAREGDSSARADLLAAFVPQIHAFVRLRMGRDLRRREESMDLVQTVCADFVKRAEGFELRTEPAFRAWLFQSALNKIREHGRFHGRERRDPGREREALADFLVHGDAGEGRLGLVKDLGRRGRHARQQTGYERIFEDFQPRGGREASRIRTRWNKSTA